MSIATELTRIQTNRDIIRTKLVELGMATSTDNLDRLAAAIEAVVNVGAVSVSVKEGETYTIPAGYHNGAGTVSGVAGGGDYDLQSKTITPTKKQQSVVPDSGYYGLSDVIVAAIPDAYQNVSSVNTTAADVLTGKIYVTADGTVTTGTMANNGEVTRILDVTSITYTIPKGYHSGTGTVSITLETKTVTPTKSTQKITPTAGMVLSEVTVNPIPEEYIVTTDATAVADVLLAGETAYVGGVKIEGTMVNNGAVSQVLDSTTPSYTVPKGFHDGNGKVSITPETKNATPTKTAQTITPSSGKVLTKVDVAAIPDAYQDVTQVTAEAADVIYGEKFVATDGTVVTGTMPVNGDVTENIDGLTKMSVTIPAGNTSGGTISLTSDIEEALAAI